MWGYILTIGQTLVLFRAHLERPASVHSGAGTPTNSSTLQNNHCEGPTIILGS